MNEELITIVDGMGARKKESGRVTFMGGSKAAVDVELTLELSGMRDCGGVRERLDALELEPSTAREISILAVWWSICGVSGWLQVECGGANVNWQNNGVSNTAETLTLMALTRLSGLGC